MHTFCLPREIIFNILVLIPAKVLHEVVRYVCKQWYDIVSDPLFVRVHRQKSSAGFLIQDPHDMTYFIEADTARLKVVEIQNRTFPGRIVGSFNGLVLIHDWTYPEIFHVMNPMTKVNISLPPVVGLDDMFSSTGFALNSSGLYKVVHVSAQKQMMVFTVGVDKAWRFIDLRGIPMNSRVKNTFVYDPCFIAGFVYWCSSKCYFGLALDVDTETIYLFSEPEDFVKNGTSAMFLSMGTCLGLMRAEGDIWWLWRLTVVKASEWTEVTGINVRAVLSKVDKMFCPSKCWALRPVRLADGDFWFYRCIGEEFVVVRYNLASESVVFFRIKNVYDSTPLHPHVHTLLSPKNC